MNDFINKILLGDARKLAATLPHNSIQCIITSPPYWGLRHYGDNSDEEIGRENTIAEYVKDLVDVFHALFPILKDNGSFWLNLGDTYRNENLMGIPWRVALALQDDGWILRNDVIWHKPNAMPSSVKNRLTVDHEYLFFFTKERTGYYYDIDAIREEHITFSEKSKMKGGRKHFSGDMTTPENGKNKGNSNLHTGDWSKAFNPKGRNKRTVWEIPLSKSRDSHFAVFPEKLIIPCILASSSLNDIILDPFMGSGTTAITALKNQRNFVGFELEEKYQIMATEKIKEYQLNNSLPLFEAVNM